jgi:hypothetical protein
MGGYNDAAIEAIKAIEAWSAVQTTPPSKG